MADTKVNGRATVRMSFEFLSQFLRMPENWNPVSVDLVNGNTLVIEVEGWDIVDGEKLDCQLKMRQVGDGTGQWYQAVWRLDDAK